MIIGQHSRGRRSSAGGAANHAGANYHHRVAAFLGVLILAEQNAPPRWGIPDSVSLEALFLETRERIDDLLVLDSSGGRTFIQVKHRLDLGKSEQSALADCMLQCVHQYVEGTSVTSGSRPLDPSKDRFVLVTGRGTPRDVSEHLSEVLNNVRALLPGQRLEDATGNAGQRNALSTVLSHLVNLWQQVAGKPPGESQQLELLRLIYVSVLDVDSEGAEEHLALMLLRGQILRHPHQSREKWRQLIAECAELAKKRHGADRSALQRWLIAHGSDLRAVRSYQEDIDHLRTYSEANYRRMTRAGCIVAGESRVSIPRQATALLQPDSPTRAVLLTSPAGSGKSTALAEFAGRLKAHGRDFVLVDLHGINGISDLMLSRPLPEVLRNWPGMYPSFLLLDGLDAGNINKAEIHILIDEVIHESTDRWHVVATIRDFDLGRDKIWAELFRGEPPSTDYCQPAFASVCHISIPPLSDTEMECVLLEVPILADVWRQSPQPIRVLLRVPFNLKLAGELLQGPSLRQGIMTAQTQLDLLDLYWDQRVVSSDGQGFAREHVLHCMAQNALSSHRVVFRRQSLALDAAFSSALHELHRVNILSSAERGPDTIGFSHQLLLDYAIARLILADTEQLPSLVTTDPDIANLFRPCLQMAFQMIWKRDASRSQFWEAAIRIVRSKEVPITTRVLAPSVAVDLIDSLSDLQPILDQYPIADHPESSAVVELVHYLCVSVLQAPTDRHLPDAWYDIAEYCNRLNKPYLFMAAGAIVTKMVTSPPVPGSVRFQQLGELARRLLDSALADRTTLLPGVLSAVCCTFATDPGESGRLLRKTLKSPKWAEGELKSGLKAFLPHLEEIRDHDVSLLADLFEAAFRHPCALGLTDQWEHGCYEYREDLHRLLKAYPLFLLDSAPLAARVAGEILSTPFAPDLQRLWQSFMDQIRKEFADEGASGESLKVITEIFQTMSGIPLQAARVGDQIGKPVTSDPAVLSLLKAVFSDEQLPAAPPRLALDRLPLRVVTRIRHLLRFYGATLSQIPSEERAARVLRRLAKLRHGLPGLDDSVVNVPEVRYGWRVLMGVSWVLSAVKWEDHSAVGLLRGLLLEGARHPDPGGRVEGPESIELDVCEPVRVSAAAGLVSLLAHPHGHNQEVLDAVFTLCADHNEQVRTTAAEGLRTLYPIAPDRVLQTVDSFQSSSYINPEYETAIREDCAVVLTVGYVLGGNQNCRVRVWESLDQLAAVEGPVILATTGNILLEAYRTQTKAGIISRGWEVYCHFLNRFAAVSEGDLMDVSDPVVQRKAEAATHQILRLFDIIDSLVERDNLDKHRLASDLLPVLQTLVRAQPDGVAVRGAAAMKALLPCDPKAVMRIMAEAVCRSDPSSINDRLLSEPLVDFVEHVLDAHLRAVREDVHLRKLLFDLLGGLYGGSCRDAGRLLHKASDLLRPQ